MTSLLRLATWAGPAAAQAGPAAAQAGPAAAQAGLAAAQAGPEIIRPKLSFFSAHVTVYITYIIYPFKTSLFSAHVTGKRRAPPGAHTGFS